MKTYEIPDRERALAELKRKAYVTGLKLLADVIETKELVVDEYGGGSIEVTIDYPDLEAFLEAAATFVTEDLFDGVELSESFEIDVYDERLSFAEPLVTVEVGHYDRAWRPITLRHRLQGTDFLKERIHVGWKTRQEWVEHPPVDGVRPQSTWETTGVEPRVATRFTDDVTVALRAWVDTTRVQLGITHDRTPNLGVDDNRTTVPSAEIMDEQLEHAKEQAGTKMSLPPEDVPVVPAPTIDDPF